MTIRLIIFLAILTPISLRAVDFAHQIVPILKEHCVECHGGDKAKGGFSLNTRSLFLEDDAAVPGNAAESYFLELIAETDPEFQMPPKKKDRVPKEQVALLKQWIDEGMPWEPGFTFGKKSWEPPLKPRAVTLPAATNGRDHPIDQILDADLAKREASPPTPLSDAAFLRRVTLDTIGLLPSPENLDSFLKDTSPDKRTEKIDSLLGSDIAYADHWLTTWNDLLRNDYTGTGFITKGRTQITPWLYASLRENKPYDQFVRELIAPPKDDSAGFINGIKWRGDVNASQTREIQFSQNISQVFLGINMKCASCHDSFIDRWKLEEAYNLAAIFSETPLELNRCDKPTGVMAEAKWIFPELGQIDSEAPKAERLEQLAGLMTHPDNGRFTRTVVNRIWERLMGRGIVHPVDAMDTQPWNEDLLDYLAVRFADDGYDLRKLIRTIMTSNAYQSQSEILEEMPGDDYTYSGPISKRMTAEQFLDSIWQITGTHPAKAEAKADRVPVSAKPIIDPAEADEISAKWIWHEGEAGTQSQLWKTFELSSAPEAAVLLATCDNAFKLKINNKAVASSKVWTDPLYLNITEHLKAGKNSIIVDAEMHGGAYGFISQIHIKESGKPLTILATDDTWKARPPKGKWAAAKVLKPHGEAPWGNILDPKAAPRTGPSPPVRAALVKNDFLMRSLGRPHRDQVVTSRPNELTTLQAIDLANGEILAEYLKQGAKNLADRGDRNDLIGWLYRHALSRPPTTEERAVLTEIAGETSDPTAIEDLLWVVFMQPEFQMIR